jgi:RNA polymerase-binding transcription factor
MVQDTFLSDMRQRLQTERTSLQSELSQLRLQTAPEETQSEHAGLGNHMADDATDLYEQEKTLALLHHTEKLLTKVEAALRKLDEGSYGSCDQCGVAIDRARLESLPYAMLCMSCKTRQEKK